jgi:hypothetical protein
MPWGVDRTADFASPCRFQEWLRGVEQRERGRSHILAQSVSVKCGPLLFAIKKAKGMTAEAFPKITLSLKDIIYEENYDG